MTAEIDYGTVHTSFLNKLMSTVAVMKLDMQPKLQVFESSAELH